MWGDVARSMSPTGGLDAGPRDIGEGVTGLAGGTDRTIGYVIGHIRDRFPIR